MFQETPERPLGPRKLTKKARPYPIEYRIIPGKQRSTWSIGPKDWRVYKRFETERQRDEALRHCRKPGHIFANMFEYRKGE